MEDHYNASLISWMVSLDAGKVSPFRASNSGAAGTTALLGHWDSVRGAVDDSGSSLSERFRSTSSSPRWRASTLLEMLVRLAERNEKSFFLPSGEFWFWSC